MIPLSPLSLSLFLTPSLTHPSLNPLGAQVRCTPKESTLNINRAFVLLLGWLIQAVACGLIIEVYRRMSRNNKHFPCQLIGVKHLVALAPWMWVRAEKRIKVY